MEKSRNKKTLNLIILIFVFLTLVSLFGAITTISGQNSALSIVFFALALLFGLTGFILIIVFIAYYNKFIKYKNKVAESLSMIDVHLKLRFDLVPSLVEVVKGYAQHEKEVFEKITTLRKAAVTTNNDKDLIKISNELVIQMKKMFIIVEDYPELKANSLFLKLMEDLRDIENKISASRRFYNANVNQYNILVEGFPSNLVALKYNFQKIEMFKIAVNEKILPIVNLTE